MAGNPKSQDFGAACVESIDVGRAQACIFCGSGKELTKEHIIPLALGGPFVYYDATCKACLPRLNSFEHPIARRYLLLMRSKLGAPTRNPGNRPAKTAVEATMTDGSVQAVEVDVADHPGTVTFLEFGPPGILVPGQDPAKAVIVGQSTITLDPEGGKRLLRRLGANQLRGDLELVPSDFLRLVGKIAYATACAEYGRENIMETPILPAILGESNDISQWVGGPPSDLPPIKPGTVHLVRTLVGEDLIIKSAVYLFADLGLQPYGAIVGRLRPGTPLPPRVRHYETNVFANALGWTEDDKIPGDLKVTVTGPWSKT